jgi:predicted choloylglycine hydrolase
VQLSGSAYNRGVQHGKALRSEIAEIVRRWKFDLQHSKKRDPDSLISEFLHDSDFLPAIKKWTPDLLDEVKGIADGSEHPFEDMLAFQLPDELWVYFDKPEAHHCSGMGVSKAATHPAYVAQNMDVEVWRDGSQTIIHILQSPGAPEQLIFTAAGLIALNGVNSSSIGVCANTLMELAASHNGLPVAFFIRGLLSKTTERSALEFIKSVNYASGQNYIVGIGDKVYDFETSATKVVQYAPVAGDSIVYHTNHALVNGDLKPWWATLLQQVTPEGLRKSNSYVRFASLESRLSKSASDINEITIKETLRSKDSELHPVCRPFRGGGSSYTFGSTVMTLSDHPSLQVTSGPPDLNEYVLFSLKSGSTPAKRVR